MMLDIVFYSPMSVGEGIERCVMGIEPYQEINIKTQSELKT